MIIPSLDEARTLPALLDDLSAQQGLRLRVIVADGGSRDGTPALARARGITVVRSARGRGRQMNCGARQTREPWLLFLHADSRLEPPDQLAQALAVMATAPEQDSAGHWPLHFLRSRPGRERFFRHLEGKTASNRPGTVHGDQGLLIRRSFFEQLGGYDESLPFIEDLRLARRIEAAGGWRLLPGRLGTSARRFEVEGHAVRYALMALMVGAETGGLHAFLSHLPALYRAQAETRQLELRPFLLALDQALQDLSPEARSQLWQQVGGLVRDNGWQLAYALDALRGLGLDGPLLSSYDRHLAPALAHPPAARILGLFTRSLIGLAIGLARREPVQAP